MPNGIKKIFGKENVSHLIKMFYVSLFALMYIFILTFIFGGIKGMFNENSLIVRLIDMSDIIMSKATILFLLLPIIDTMILIVNNSHENAVRLRKNLLTDWQEERMRLAIRIGIYCLFGLVL